MSVPYAIIFCLLGCLFFLLCLRFRLTFKWGESDYETGACKTIGSREVQEDFYAVKETENGILAVLSDGMGKEIGGKLASKTIVKTFLELFLEYNALDHPRYFFQKAFQTANREVLKLYEEGRGCAAVSSVMIRDGILYYALVGNVKIAVYRKKELVPLGTGHTLDVLAKDKYYQGMITREDALEMLQQKRVYNYLGKDGFKDIEFYDEPVRLYEKDIVVLMSDGVYEGMSWKQIEDYLSAQKSCQRMAYEIIEHINRKQGRKDNSSIVLIKIGE